VRISLTNIAIVIFIILIPMIVGISLRSFTMDSDSPAVEAQKETLSDRITTYISERFPDAPGLWLVVQLFRIIIGVTIIGIVVGVISSRGLTAPLSKLAEAAKAIGSKDLGRRVEIMGSDEVKAVAQAFNDMAAELEQAETLRHNLLTDVAHELRTPITVIQGNLRAILDDVYELDKAEIARLYEQTRHLSRLVEDLRDLSHAEANQLRLNVAQVEVASWLEATAAAFVPIAKEKSIDLQVNISESAAAIQADQARLTQCLQNLLNNAIMHTPPNGSITIQAEQTPGELRLQITDTGSGIAPEHLPHIFNRFYRADPARSRETGGTGLGLSITHALIKAHGGEITATSEGAGKGSQFTIRLPISEKSR
jgi:signal transduction histidine kinase